MGIGKSLIGICIVEITSASIADTLTAVNHLGIQLRNISYCDELHVRAEIYGFEVSRLRSCLSQRGDDLIVIGKKGIFWTLKGLSRRPVLIAGILLFISLTFYLPSRIFFVLVEGNDKVSTQLIIDKAESCGIVFGASRREIRSEKMKNALLGNLPELQWAGINTAGCVAVISVKERTDDRVNRRPTQATSIIAARDGIIMDMVVLQGNPLSRVGQAVKEGQLLVSGYTDCGLIIKATSAEAEITALTHRNLSAVTPMEYTVRRAAISEKRRYLIRIGKNIINFCKYSGISDTRCVKIYEEKIMTLPGGFQLPVSLITERTIYFDVDTVTVNNSDDLNWMEISSDKYLQIQMQSGEILNSTKVSDISDGVYCLNSAYSCKEMIGKVREEGFVSYNGKAN